MINMTECLDRLNNIIKLPDSYYLEVSKNDTSLISLCKIDKNKNEKIINQFILESYDTQSIVELGLEIGEIICKS